MEERKRRGRRAYLDSFRKDSKGEYEYTGKTYTFRGSRPGAEKEEFRRALRILWAVSLVLLAAWITPGCTRVPGMSGSFYVLIPYAGGLVEGIRVCWALGRVTADGSMLKEYQYEGSVKVLPRRSAATAVCVGVCMLGEIVYVCRNGFGGLAAGSGILLVMGLAALAAAAVLYRYGSALKCRFAEA